MSKFLMCSGAVLLVALCSAVALVPMTAFAVKPEAGKALADTPGQWVDCNNGALSIRAHVKESAIGADDGIVLVAQIRNNSGRSITLLRPFGDPYLARGIQIKIWNEERQIRYSGAKADYDLDGAAFMTVAPGASVTGTIDLLPQDFAGIGRAGVYAVRYDYSYSGDWDEKVAKEGVKNIWTGAICSREIAVERKQPR
jgi:hypothetical protein